jgi:hypothetical protein
VDVSAASSATGHAGVQREFSIYCFLLFSYFATFNHTTYSGFDMIDCRAEGNCPATGIRRQRNHSQPGDRLMISMDEPVALNQFALSFVVEPRRSTFPPSLALNG